MKTTHVSAPTATYAGLHRLVHMTPRSALMMRSARYESPQDATVHPMQPTR